MIVFSEKWRAIMRQAKSAELKKEIVILSQTFERIMDRKSAVIQQLAKDLEESEEQNRMATRAHQSNLGKLNEVDRIVIFIQFFFSKIPIKNSDSTIAGG